MIYIKGDCIVDIAVNTYDLSSMKTYLKLIFALIIFCPMASLAQTDKMLIGIEGGPNISFFRINESRHHKPGIGFSSGLALQYNFSNYISFRTNVLFERKGMKGVYPTVNGSGVVFNERFDYLTVPLLVRGAFGNKMKFFLNAGPYFSFLLKQTVHVEPSGDFPESVTDETHRYNRFDTGLTIGLGSIIPLTNKMNLSLELRNNLGLYNIGNDEFYLVSGGLSTNSTNLLIGIVYSLGYK